MYDYDNDGDLDIHVTNGHVIDNVKLYTPALAYEQKDLLYENTAESSRTCPLWPAALQNTRVGRGLAVADFDNDGFLDVAISSLGRHGRAAEESRGFKEQLDRDPRGRHDQQQVRARRHRPGPDAGRPAGARDQQRGQLSERQ